MLLKTNEKTLATKFQMSAFKGAYKVVKQTGQTRFCSHSSDDGVRELSIYSEALSLT